MSTRSKPWDGEVYHCEKTIQDQQVSQMFLGPRFLRRVLLQIGMQPRRIFQRSAADINRMFFGCREDGARHAIRSLPLTRGVRIANDMRRDQSVPNEQHHDRADD
jgi:hypothetical protein